MAPGAVSDPDRPGVVGTGTRMSGRQVLRAGLGAGAAAGAAMALTLMLIAEVAAEPTPIPGISSSTWTPLTAITSFLFGPDAFAGSFQVLPVTFGAAWHLLNSVMAGVAGVALLIWLLGPRPHPVAAAVLGFLYGLTLEVVVLNLLVNGIQDLLTVYEALPQWGWWVGHAAFGSTLGLVLALRQRA